MYASASAVLSPCRSGFMRVALSGAISAPLAMPSRYSSIRPGRGTMLTSELYVTCDGEWPAASISASTSIASLSRRWKQYPDSSTL
jgi:hypothetical protein